MDVKSLKVQELRDLLAARSLSIAGLKAELVTRLEEAMAANPDAVMEPATGEEHVAEAALDETAAADTTSPPAAAAKAPRNRIVFPSSTPAVAVVAAAAAPPAAASAPAVAVAEAEPAAPAEPEVPSKHPKIQFHSEKSTASAPLKVTRPAGAAPVVAPVAVPAAAAGLTELEKQKLRATKFQGAEATKAQLRAERFHLPTPEAKPDAEADKAAARAQKFKTIHPVVEEDEKKRARAAKFGVAAAPVAAAAAVVQEDKMAKRADRFAPAPAKKAADAFEPLAIQEAFEARKKARAESLKVVA